ncbi:hypothetical protein ElyMa_000808500 [Elysia marginata]|uniref:Secreted protein n=1 Tax=Elysia marginata TaxID=1093978 RepID=A0AAV4GY90_9GAST|nr:hypothetical protein ElyMa_000808500 [Elysia marginata]
MIIITITTIIMISLNWGLGKLSRPARLSLRFEPGFWRQNLHLDQATRMNRTATKIVVCPDRGRLLWPPSQYDLTCSVHHLVGSPLASLLEFTTLHTVHFKSSDFHT